MTNKLGSLTGGFLTFLVGLSIEERRRLIQKWRDSGYGYKKRLNDRDFRQLVKIAINGELK